MSVDRRRSMVEAGYPQLSVARQCALIEICRSSLHRPPAPETAGNLALMRVLDEQLLEAPWYGARRLRRLGHAVGCKLVRREMGTHGLASICQWPPSPLPHRINPYLLPNMRIDRLNQAWCVDIPYIPMWRGFLYLVAGMDWATRRVLSWRLSNTMDAEFCVAVREEALGRGRFSTATRAAGSHRRDSPRC